MDILAPENNARVRIRYIADEARVEVRSPFSPNNRAVLSAICHDIDWDRGVDAWVGTLSPEQVEPLARTLKLQWMGPVKIESRDTAPEIPTPTQVVSTLTTSWKVEVL